MNPKSLLQLKEFLKTLQQGVSRDEFLKAFEIFMSVLKDMKILTEKNNKDVMSETTKAVSDCMEKTDTVCKEMKKDSSKLKVDFDSKVKQITNLFKEDISTIKKVYDPEFIDTKIKQTKKYFEEKFSKLPPELTGEKIVDKINALPIEPELQIDKDHIKGLKEEIESLKKLIGKGGGSQTFVGGGRGRIKSYDLSSQLDGVTKTFNLPAVWTVVSVHSTSFPIAFRPITDYTFTSTTITFTDQVTASSTLASGQTLVVVYEEQ